MEKRDKLYEGKAKILYATDDKDLVIQYFKDEATAGNGKKKGIVDEKGIMNNGISSKVFEFLSANGVPTHFVKKLSDREMLVKKVEIVKIEVIIRNRAAGSLCRNYGVEEGKTLVCPILEFCYKEDKFNDPLINDYHIRALGIATDKEVEKIKEITFKVNELMTKFFLALKIELIDFKLEFGRYKGDILLADEVSPDTCRLWEVGTGVRLDKDRFRNDLGNIKEGYQEVLKRVSGK
ncbi:MAG: phosphoribosylaminoimidazolesuccinocarboxamide synthase [Candidatus Omnitrophica bacterium]|nr:phosphoribosylaminoimidazolesuccinocarboxamide synthase [Candidatus Omnitrophota bacterium]